MFYALWVMTDLIVSTYVHDSTICVILFYIFYGKLSRKGLGF